MTADATPAIRAYLAGNRGPTATDPVARERPDYVVSASFDGTVIDLTLTFRAGAAYCCGEWPCHFMLFPTKRWDALRRELAALGLELADRLELRVEVVIEAGALFFSPNNRPNTPPKLIPAAAFQYGEAVTEAVSPEAVQDG